MSQMERGQINMYTPIGKVLFDLIEQDTSIKSILDVGSWNGLGTTLCCVLGATARLVYKPVYIIAVEANPEFFEKGKQAWEKRPGKEMIFFYKGHIAESMMTDAEIRAHSTFDGLKPHYDLWYKSDIKHFNESQRLELNGQIDLAILDGGEYCGFQDYLAVLKCNPKYLVLDDYKTMKNDKSLEHALKNGFSVVFKNDERNGSIILRRT